MFSLAMGIPSGGPAGRFGPDEDEWWEGAVAVARVEQGRLRSLQLHPIDLGLDMPVARRGIPRKPTSTVAVRMLERLARLSKRYDTAIHIENGIGVVEIR
jgi:poly-gamma-glutamate synthesis protein (capsule biosynthesis protein)